MDPFGAKDCELIGCCRGIFRAQSTVKWASGQVGLLARALSLVLTEAGLQVSCLTGEVQRLMDSNDRLKMEISEELKPLLGSYLTFTYLLFIDLFIVIIIVLRILSVFTSFHLFLRFTELKELRDASLVYSEMLFKARFGPRIA